MSYIMSNVCFLFNSHKSKVKGNLRLKMSYLPKSSGSEEENAEQGEEIEVGFIALLFYLHLYI